MGREGGVGGVWRACGVAVREASGRPRRPRWVEVRRALRSERDGLRQEAQGFALRGVRRMGDGAAAGVAHAKNGG